MMVKNDMLKRYWLVIYPENRFGPGNIGVTAYSLEHAKKLITNTFASLNWTHITQNQIDKAEIIEGIDVGLLDPGHVIPNMGVVIFEGVWFPFRNL